MALLRAKHIVPADPVRSVDWPRIVRVAEIWGGRKRQSAGSFSVALTSLASLVSRLEWHRDESWDKLGGAGWIPFTKLWRYDAEEGKSLQGVSILVGFYKTPGRKAVRRAVYAVNFGLELSLCSADKTSPPPRLSIWSYRSLKGQARDDGRSVRTDLREYGSFPRRSVRDIFQRDWDLAHKALSGWMRRGLTQFKNSAGWDDMRR